MRIIPCFIAGGFLCGRVRGEGNEESVLLGGGRVYTSWRLVLKIVDSLGLEK